MSAEERSGWRDQDLSKRHRDWGFNCPAADMDFPVVEYNLGLPVAVIEYRHSRAQWPPPLLHPTFRAIREMADGYRGSDGRRGPLPFAVVRYAKDPWRFGVRPVNQPAISAFGFGGPNNPEKRMTELEYVRCLYALRNQTLETSVLNTLDNELPEQRAA